LAHNVDVTTETPELTAADLATTVMPYLQGVTDAIFGAINQLAELVQAALDSRVVCVTCAAEQQRAAAAGTPEHELPPLNAANLILTNTAGQTQSLCFAHVQFTDKPVLPGQTASGLYVAGQVS
jgi:hypothetical protein